ncbi:MAG: hypothetical protein ACHP7P_06855 [Terriglobales bacterium]
MSGRCRWGIIGFVLAAALAYSQTDPQSLGDAARQARLAHKGAQASKVITNDDPGFNASPNAPRLLANTDVLKIVSTDLGQAIELDIRVPADTIPIIKVDVNQNGAIDKGLDTYYGVHNNQNCTGYLIDDRHSTFCNSFLSKSDLTVTLGADGKHFKWTIPKHELSSRAGEARFIVGYSSKNHGGGYFPSPWFSNPIRLIF